MPVRESSVVTRLIETSRRQPIGDRDAPPPQEADVTQRVRVALPRRSRALPIAVLTTAVATGFVLGMFAAERRPSHELSPVVIPAPAPATGPIARPAPVAEAPPAPAAALDPDTAAETGFDLRVEPPGAQVILDGRVIGQAPVRVRNVQPGQHRIELSAPGYEQRETLIEVEAGEAALYDLVLDRASVPLE